MIEPPNGIDLSQSSNNDKSTAPVMESSSGDNFAVPKKKIENGSQSDSSNPSSKRGRKAKNAETKKRKVVKTTDSEFYTGREEMEVNEAISSEAFNKLHKRLILLVKTNVDQRQRSQLEKKNLKKRRKRRINELPA